MNDFMFIKINKDNIEKTAAVKHNDPYRATKQVATLNAFDNVLDVAQDSGSMALAMILAGAPKTTVKQMIKNPKEFFSNVKPSKIKSTLTSPESREGFKNFWKQQKVSIPLGIATSGAYVLKAYNDDKKALGQSKKASVEDYLDEIYKQANEIIESVK